MLAAQLRPDAEEWARLATLAEELGKTRTAVELLRRAAPAMSSARCELERVRLLMELKDKRGALDCYNRVLTLLLRQKS